MIFHYLRGGPGSGRIRGGARLGPKVIPKGDHSWSQSGPDPVPIWSRTDPKLAQIWSRTGPDLVQNWSRSGPELVQTWSSTGPDLVQNWPRTDPELSQNWARSGREEYPTRYQRRAGKFSLWSRLGPETGPKSAPLWDGRWPFGVEIVTFPARCAFRKW